MKNKSYTLKTPGFEGVEFIGPLIRSERNPWYNAPQAITRTAAHSSILPSAQELMAFYIEKKGNIINSRKLTRTYAIYLSDGGKEYVAFDDSPDKGKNILLAERNRCYQAHNKHEEFLLPKSRACVTQALERASKAGRILQLKYQYNTPTVTKDLCIDALFGSIQETPSAPFGRHDDNCRFQVSFFDITSPDFGIPPKFTAPFPEDSFNQEGLSRIRNNILKNYVALRTVSIGGLGHPDSVCDNEEVEADFRANGTGDVYGVRNPTEFKMRNPPEWRK